jgi:hypothetical protein
MASQRVLAAALLRYAALGAVLRASVREARSRSPRRLLPRGLVAIAVGPIVPGVVALGAGQALAVPALGLLALARVEPARHGAAAGLFFSWFDAGVGLGGPAAGVLASLGGPTGALVGAAIAVAYTAPIALLRTGSRAAGSLVN